MTTTRETHRIRQSLSGGRRLLLLLLLLPLLLFAHRRCRTFRCCCTVWSSCAVRRFRSRDQCRRMKVGNDELFPVHVGERQSTSHELVADCEPKLFCRRVERILLSLFFWRQWLDRDLFDQRLSTLLGRAASYRPTRGRAELLLLLLLLLLMLLLMCWCRMREGGGRDTRLMWLRLRSWDRSAGK